MTRPLVVFDIPIEVLQRILSLCHPRDVAAFSKTCRSAFNLIYHPDEQHLWRQLYLAYPFDHPEEVVRARAEAGLSVAPKSTQGVNWRRRLTDFMRAERTATGGHPASTMNDRRHALEVFLAALEEPPIAQTAHSEEELALSYTLQWLEKSLRDSPLLADPSEPDSDVNAEELQQVCAHLRCCLSSTFEGYDEFSAEECMDDRRVKGRAFVYDLRNYGADTLWGPFLRDNRINWVHIEHLMLVIWMNLCDLPVPDFVRPSVGLESIRPYSAPGCFTSEDWAGVEGTWSRYVCFMDYRDLFAFNYSDANGPRQANFFKDPMFREATRLLEVTLRLVPADPIHTLAAYGLTVSSTHGGPRPPLFFAGSSRGPTGTESVLKGFVYMEGDSTVRWRFMSIYDNSPQWSSTGVQVGDVGSAVGVVGVWTTTTHEQGDPVGPFWLWKNKDEQITPVMEYT